MADHERLQRAVDELRAQRSPPEGARERVFAALEGGLGGPPDGDGGGGDGGGLEPTGAGLEQAGAAKLGVVHGAEVVGATAGLAATGVLALRLGVLAVRAVSGVGESPGDAEAPIEERAEQVAAPSEAPAPTQVDAELQAETERAPAAEPEPTGGQPHREPRGAAKPDGPGDDLEAELALIRAARAAEDPKASLASLRRHAERFPDGSLADEREALWALAACELGQLDDARARAGALAERRPESPLIDRMLAGCPKLAQTLPKR